jgi:hypothetical protein
MNILRDGKGFIFILEYKLTKSFYFRINELKIIAQAFFTRLSIALYSLSIFVIMFHTLALD